MNSKGYLQVLWTDIHGESQKRDWNRASTEALYTIKQLTYFHLILAALIALNARCRTPSSALI